MQDGEYDLRRIHQRAEKVGIELIATINQAPRAPESVRLMPDFG
jgi:hypothetical protein